jgi:hypothetical protein
VLYFWDLPQLIDLQGRLDLITGKLNEVYLDIFQCLKLNGINGWQYGVEEQQPKKVRQRQHGANVIGSKSRQLAHQKHHHATKSTWWDIQALIDFILL